MADEENQKVIEDYQIKWITEKVFDWLVDITYWYGWTRGAAYEKEQGDAKKSIYIIGYEPHPSRLQFRWSIYYGHFYLEIKDCEAESFSSITLGGRHIDSLVVINNRERYKLDALEVDRLAQSLEKLVKKFFPGIQQMNGLRICKSPAHNTFTRGEQSFFFKPHPRVCNFIGDVGCARIASHGLTWRRSRR